MAEIRRVAVVDIGKTNAKIVAVDAATLVESGVRKIPNRVLPTGPYPHFDTDALWDFVQDGLAALNREEPFDAVSVTAHGAAAVLLRADGSLAMPVLDYEHDGPESTAAAYDAERPPFAETGSPRLSDGLNVGAQLFWQERAFPELWAGAAAIVGLPQYWSHRLSGVAASEPTWLGAHTDLWNPQASDFSSLVAKRGWRALFPALKRAGDVLGPVEPALAARLGLRPDIPVLCGIHDSNASLLPHLLTREPPFTVVSTGTWVIMFAVGGVSRSLDPARDTLMNVNAFGEPVPSARFMGGREHAVLTAGLAEGWSEADLASVLDAPVLLLPAVEGGSGPFQGRTARWLAPASLNDGERRVAAAFYLAMVTATSLGLIGAAGPIVVEGPLAGSPLYLAMLAAAAGQPVIPSGGGTGTSAGAALLALGNAGTRALPAALPIDPPDASWSRYAEHWNRAVAASGN